MENRNLLYRLFSFKGRMARKPFWIAYMINTLAGALLVLMFVYITRDSSFVSENATPVYYLMLWGIMAVTLNPYGALLVGESIYWSSTHWLWIVIWGVLLIVLLINRWALIARRLHDTNRSFTVVYLGLFMLRLGISTLFGMVLPVVNTLICWGIVIGILVILLQRSKTEIPNTSAGQCKTCLNREHNLKDGELMCNLTHKKPSFESPCMQYQEDVQTGTENQQFQN